MCFEELMGLTIMLAGTIPTARMITKEKYISTYPSSTYNTELLENNDKSITRSNSLISLE